MNFRNRGTILGASRPDPAAARDFISPDGRQL
jgi:hypothetical protein